MTSAKNPDIKDQGFFLSTPTITDTSSANPQQRRSRRFDQVLDDDEFIGDGFDGTDGDALVFGDRMDGSGLTGFSGPIKCDEDDDGPDFSRMVKKADKTAAAKTGTKDGGSAASQNRKDEDIRKRFQIEKPKGATTATGTGLLTSPGSAKSHGTVSTDLSLNNPLAESLTSDMILRQ